MRILLVPLVVVLTFSCSSHKEAARTGQEGGPCFPNRTCLEGLACLSKLCVRVSDGSATDGMLDDGGTPDQTSNMDLPELLTDGPVADAPDEDICSADCAPASMCGDGKCEGSENATNCPQDCKATVTCGDGKCEGSENAKNCPSDCGPAPVCKDDERRCKDAVTLEFCEKGQWTTEGCSSICTQSQYDYAVGCSSSKSVCICDDYAKYGDPCSKETKCGAGLDCVSVSETGTISLSQVGFCSKKCTLSCSGTGSFTSAYCSADNYCIFECDILTTCPRSLYCNHGSGTCEP
jgi:hypothetical protein